MFVDATVVLLLWVNVRIAHCHVTFGTFQLMQLRVAKRNALRQLSEKCEISTPVVFITQVLSNSGTSFILFYIICLTHGAMTHHSLMIRSGNLASCFSLKGRTA